ncbi:hypothetical protein [Candidatus Nitrosocosmicus sp. FF01]|uniref:hypothetical protein n=1 Tax=Candidatus Nitrosocosmicus sp. FF01 TaxID=3397670 RepID=UPI0039E8EDC3
MTKIMRANYNLISIVTVVIYLALAMVASPPIVYALPKMDPGDPGICIDTGKKQGPNGAAVFNCCWHESVPPGTGGVGENLDKEEYCMECEDGGTRGYINCTEPELQYRDGGSDDKPRPPISDTLNNGQIFDDTQAEDNRSPATSSTEGVEDHTPNDNGGNGNNEDTSNRIPTKGGSLDTSTLN